MSYAYDKQIGQQIKRIRELKHWSQEDLAAKLQEKECDITRSALAKIEVGQRHLYAYEIKRLKEVLHVTYDELFV